MTDFQRSIEALIRKYPTDKSVVALWHFDNITDEDNVSKTREFQATFDFNEEKGGWMINERYWELRIRMDENHKGGWMIVAPVPQKGTSRHVAAPELPKQAKRSLEEIQAWWKDNNPFMGKEVQDVRKQFEPYEDSGVGDEFPE